MDELRSWWEVPAIAHFFSLFKSCFSLSDFTIEELEEALLTDGEDEKSTHFVSRFLMELLQGYYNNTNITISTCHDWLRRIMKECWEEVEGRINPLSSIEANFHKLPLRLKVQIIHRITEYRLDAADVESKLQGLNATDLRLEPLGSDRNGAKFWYFFGVRLYKESPAACEKATEKIQLKKKKKKAMKIRYNGIDPKSLWSVACYSVGDWKKTARKMKGTESRRERALVQLITNNFLPNLPKIVEDMERQKLMKLQSEPRRSSCRLLARKLCEAQEEADKKCALEHAEKIRREREERERMRGDFTTSRMKIDFDKMIRLELERKWKDIAEKKRQELLKETEDFQSSSGDEEVWNDPKVEPKSNTINNVRTKAGKRKVQNESMKKGKKVETIKNKNKNSESKKLQKRNSLSSDANSKGRRRSLPNGWNRREEVSQKRRLISRQSDSDDDNSRDKDEVDQLSMQKVMSAVESHPEAWQFSSPIDESIAPGYHSIIKRPMDLSEIERKLGSGEYSSPNDFVSDMTLMFNNCRLYNGPESEYTEVADKIDEMFRDLVQKHLPHVEIGDVMYKAVYPDPEPVSEDAAEAARLEDLKSGATTRAAWRSNIQSVPEHPAGRKSRGRGRGRGRGGGRGRGVHVARRVRGGRRSSRRLSLQREKDESQVLEENVEAADEQEKENLPDEEVKNQEVAEFENPVKGAELEVACASSSSSSRNSSVERSVKKVEECEMKSKPQNVWSLDFLASQARVLEQQQQQQRPTREDKSPPIEKRKNSLTENIDDVITDDAKLEQQKKAEKQLAKISEKAKNPVEEDVYNFKDEDESLLKIDKRHASRGSVISSTRVPSPVRPPTAQLPNFPLTPTPVYPMTPGYPDPPKFQSPPRPARSHSVGSDSPPTPSSSECGSNTPVRSLSTLGEGVLPLNPPSSPEKQSPNCKATSFAEKHKLPRVAPPVVVESHPKTPVAAPPAQRAEVFDTSRIGPTKTNESVTKLRPEKSVPPPSPDGPSTTQHLQKTPPVHPITSQERNTNQLRNQPSTVQQRQSLSGLVSHSQSHLQSSNVRPQLAIHQSQSKLSSRPYSSSSLPGAPSDLPTTEAGIDRPRPLSHGQRTAHANIQRPQVSSHMTTLRPQACPPYRPPQQSQPRQSAPLQAPPRTKPRTSQPSSLPTSMKGRNSPRNSYPDYGGMNTADRYSTSARGYDRPLSHSSHVVQSANISSEQQNKNQSSASTTPHSVSMAGFGLNWGLSSSMEPKRHTEQRKASLQGRNSLPSSTSSPHEARSRQRLKQTQSGSAQSSRVSGLHSIAQYPTEYMGYPFSSHHSPSPHDFSAQQNGLLSAATNPSLLHSDLTASATLRVLQQQQQHKPTDLQNRTSSMFLQAGHYPSAAQPQADQYSRLATAAAAQHHQLNMYHQSPNAAQNAWLQLHPSQMDPVYHLMQQHGQYPMYHNILHKY